MTERMHEYGSKQFLPPLLCLESSATLSIRGVYNLILTEPNPPAVPPPFPSCLSTYPSSESQLDYPTRLHTRLTRYHYATAFNYPPNSSYLTATRSIGPIIKQGKHHGRANTYPRSSRHKRVNLDCTSTYIRILHQWYSTSSSASRFWINTTSSQCT